MEHRMTMPLRWRDLDTLGHLNQAVYHELLEDVRAALLDPIIQAPGDDGPKNGFVLAHTDLDYHGEVRLDDSPVEAVARVAEVGTKSLTIEHEIRVGDRVAASGCVVCVAWDGEARQAREFTDEERAALSA